LNSKLKTALLWCIPGVVTLAAFSIVCAVLRLGETHKPEKSQRMALLLCEGAGVRDERGGEIFRHCVSGPLYTETVEQCQRAQAAIAWAIASGQKERPTPWVVSNLDLHAICTPVKSIVNEGRTPQQAITG